MTTTAKRTRKPAPELTRPIATTGDGRDITRPWVQELEQPRDPRLMQSVDWGVYDRIRKDDQVKSCMEQRIRAVVSAEWDVLPGDEKDPASVKAAEAFKANLERVGVDRFTKKMLWAIFYGYAVAELNLGVTDGLWSFDQVIVRHARRFRYDKDRNLRLLTMKNSKGELLPDQKFWVLSEGGTYDDEIYGEGLADWLYWPTLFKRNGIRFWNIFLDKFGTPTAKATYRRGTPQKDVDKVIQALQAMATDSGFAVPEGIAVEFLQAARSGVGDYKELCRYMDEAIAKIILSQTMTTQDGSSLSQAQVHAGVKLEVVKADADLLSDSFNEGPARWWTDWNFGTHVAAPQLVRLVEEEADLKLLAETDAILANQGWVRKEESFRDIYGDGYERKEPAAPDPAREGAKISGETPAESDNDNPPEEGDGDQPKALAFAATDRRALYVHRRLKNARDLIAWARAQGFRSTLPASEMHVTITYSRTPVNWMKMGQSWGPENGQLVIGEGGPRMVERLGEKGAVVLHFASFDLDYRNREMREQGASWDFPSYQPHVTLTYDADDVDLAAVTPYAGKLVFGPEIFEPLDDEWDAGLSEISLAEMESSPDITRPRSDVIDGLVGQLIKDNDGAPLNEAQTGLVNMLANSSSFEDFDLSLLEAFSTQSSSELAQTLARAGFAVRLAAETGEA